MNLKAELSASSLSVRAEPVQQRSAERITSLLDAAAELIDSHGIDGLTTSDVATRSGSSVGVVYRYFPNIQSLLKALAARNLDKFTTRLQETLPEDTSDSFGAMNAAIDAYLELARSEAGFRALRFGDVIDDRFISDEPARSTGLAAMFKDILVTRYGINSTPELEFDIEVLVEVGDALLHRAFRYDQQGDERFITRLRELTQEFIDAHDAA
ncbi:AcrR family transcriptional regulator [Microbacteriaceae bacterium SG_E_30_P1]|uniref:AcrR family transcriptional regulator n=1 Tax=Antiquaquibacter oligotrophicus TaxID=2880260 RepID=A0ABT6KNJ1_9MICO|nr:TetR/AcrR family transcriptional regulator [Antiquaquibacter oligotrophicus]MDH6181429.1 AcrR family transcriptional regulator [Antiquaquibacter oligotrophicus]UDF12879.1 TetR family transcriptional regulator [Antiquaquibacter oligotrophicus]